jgi:hypothetical protein
MLQVEKDQFIPLPKSPKGEPRMGVLLIKTDVKKRGLASADRNNKTTLPLTAPYSMTKSYAKGLSPRMVKLQDVS